MNLKNVSVRWKLLVPIILFVAAGITLTVVVSGYKTKSIVVEEVKKSTLNGYRDTVLNAFTTMMMTGNFKESKEPFLEQMHNIVDIKAIRSEVIDKDYGKGNTKDYASDSIEKEVIEKGIERVVLDGEYIRGVYPYIAKSNFMGKNCLNCHAVREGTVLGAVSIKVPVAESFGRIKSLQYFYIALGLTGLVMMTGLVLVIIRITLAPLTTLIENVKKVGEGYIETSLFIEGKDEIAKMSQNVDGVIRYFSKMLNSIIIASSGIAPTVDALRKRAEATSRGAKNQAGQAHQIAAAAEEMTQTISDIARSAADASSSSSEAMDIAESGKEITDASVETINKVNSSTTELAGMVNKLNNRVGEIGDIITVIKDIADQTNLLALNAAIEAARAGDQGRGFAVVADEVRKLAEKTIKATIEISERIGAVQSESVQTAKSMAESAKGVTKATGHVRNLNNVLQTIVESVQTVRDQITQIATAVEEQSSASEEVAQNVEKTSSISKDTEKLADEVISEVNKLVSISDELRTATEKVRTKDMSATMLDVAKSDHRIFLGKISSCLKGSLSLDPSQLPDHHNCRFGKWYDTDGHAACGMLPSFKSINSSHAKIHSLAKEAVATYNAGDKAKAERIYRDMEGLSEEIASMLDDIKSECHSPGV